MNRPWYSVAKELCKAKKVTQQSIADHLGVTKGAVSQWFSGLTHPRIEILIEIAKMLDVTPGELVSEDIRFLTDATEIKIIETVRNLPQDKKEEAARLLEAFFQASPSPPPTPPT